MNELLKTKIFQLLLDSSAVTNEEMQSVYGCFMKRVEAVTQSEKDYSIIFRTLNTTRIELVAVQALHRYEQGEKCPKTCLSAKSISGH
ncbi:hypothetical protein LJC57_01040 [Parabacteroides sp. OttesenSCG-928-G07]|nr:hypothetical protein [Parabacteroides sp. OttesenSCG-928-G21]MDL2277155.1 hypothetical protein [Parabacteroides sp. OttesenSCG-928-G07]MDU1889574.1 hypothetical protein [Dysgonomonas sp.]